jgi:hypothetical protein
MMTTAPVVNSGQHGLLQHRGSRVRVRHAEIEVGGGWKVELTAGGDGNGGVLKFGARSGAPIASGG